MCHNSLLEEEQIKKFVEYGMPLKVLKNIKISMQKQRAEEDRKHRLQNTACNDLHIGNSNFLKDRCLADSTIDNTPLQDAPLSAATNEIYLQHLSKVKLTAIRTHEISDLDYYSNKKLSEKIMIPKNDFLSKITYFIKSCGSHLRNSTDRMRNRKIYKLLTATTQFAHVLAILLLFLVLFAIWPQHTRSTESIRIASSPTESEESHAYDHIEHQQNIIPLIIYLGAFATHFGAQIWMTFVSGIALYFSLPRHMFGQCQKILFPKYFTLNAILSIIMLVLYIKCFLTTWSKIKCVQLFAIALIGTTEIILRLYLTPTLLYLMVEKYKMEDSIGSGKEIGNLVQGDLIKCPHYQRIHKAFRRHHLTVAIGNIFTLIASCLHLYYLATIIRITI